MPLAELYGGQWKPVFAKTQPTHYRLKFHFQQVISQGLVVRAPRMLDHPLQHLTTRVSAGRVILRVTAVGGLKARGKFHGEGVTGNRDPTPTHIDTMDGIAQLKVPWRWVIGKPDLRSFESNPQGVGYGFVHGFDRANMVEPHQENIRLRSLHPLHEPGVVYWGVTDNLFTRKLDPIDLGIVFYSQSHGIPDSPIRVGQGRPFPR